jgi:HEAT repeat protein
VTVDLKQLAEKISTATGNANLILSAATLRKVPLENVNRFKEAVRRNLQAKELKKLEGLMNSCYLAIATIADLPPATGQTWSPQEKLEFQQQLAPLLDSPNPNHVLISCLGCIGDKRLSPRLIELLAHNDQLKRRSAAIALGNIGDPKALPALQHIAETDPYQQSDDRYPVRWSANEAIKKIRQKKVGLACC